MGNFARLSNPLPEAEASSFQKAAGHSLASSAAEHTKIDGIFIWPDAKFISQGPGPQVLLYL
jgi:hypothetical protein